MPESQAGVLDRARIELGLSQSQLWLLYFALGGMSDEFEMEAFLVGALRPSPHDHDLIAHALNELFSEHGRNHPIPYLADRQVNGMTKFNKRSASSSG